MARDDDTKRSLRRLDKRIDNTIELTDRLYQSTYSSRTDNKDTLSSINDKIDDNLDALISKVNGQEISDISNLYIRLKNKEKSGKKDIQNQINDSIESLFDNNKQILDTINLDNIRRSIKSENYQYDLICRYMTKLEDALDIKKDNVLSSDNFTKDFINVVSDKSSKTFIDIFNNRAIQLKNKYKIQSLFEDMYYKTSKYGEYFLYHVPYKRAFDRLLERKKHFASGIRFESTIMESGSFINDKNKKIKIEDKNLSEYLNECSKYGGNVKIIFDDSAIVPEPIEFFSESNKILKKQSMISICESFNSDMNSSTISEAELKYDDSEFSSDGIIVKGKEDTVDESIKGSVLYEIPRENIIPIYMHRTPIGYLYIQVSNNYVEDLVLNGNTYNSLTNTNKFVADEVEKQEDMIVSQIAGLMSDQIDAKFINANLDLKEQIYAVLRYNDYFSCTHGTNMITVSFLPVEDVHHFYFRLDDKTHRGISDLAKSVVPAMIYCLLYLNTTLGTISRGQDKRVYYVKQNVEQNVARTLLNVITQLKKGNMGMRQLESMNTIFNIIGKYNDHVIPMGQSGDPPIQMEVMQGQQIDTPSELMERMEDAAVSATDVPVEFVQSVNNVDYATRFTMSNSKFLRKVYKRQSICQEHFTEIFRKIYNYEFNENDTTMKILLPAPAFMAMSNSQQLIDNIKQYAQSIADIACYNEEDEVKNEFLNLYIRNQLGTYVDFSQIDQLINTAKLNIEARKQEEVETTDVGGGDEW